MTEGLLRTQLNEGETLLKKLNLLRSRVRTPRYDTYSAADYRRLTYREAWKLNVENELFDFRLTDDSLIQLRGQVKPLSLSYSYLEAPDKPVVDYEVFLASERVLRGAEADEYEIVRDYDLLVPTPRDQVTPIRYDYAPDDYCEGRHPASHFHFGHGNQTRVGTRRILRPLSFLLFVIRQRYPDAWQMLLQLPTADVLCRNVCSGLDSVAADYLRIKDGFEMYLDAAHASEIQFGNAAAE